ncbi:MAG: hypothetical protein COA74_00745 [Gammaproteobacteria bacterium]|nr:MAG: hypothetical protein COA74_00745 [Gammaproteobacteria bacterium]
MLNIWLKLQHTVHYKKQLLVLICLLLNLTSVKASATLSKVRFVEITDSSSNQQLKITDDARLNRFYYYWSQKQPLHSTKSAQTYQWRYQLQIQDKNEQRRWVYDPRGYAREVTLNKSSVIYQFSSVRSFNRFIVHTKKDNKNEY